MVIEEIVVFELKRPGPNGSTCTLTTAYSYDKTKISKENLRVNYYLLLKHCTRQCTLLSPIRAKSLTKFNPKMPDFNDVWN